MSPHGYGGTDGSGMLQSIFTFALLFGVNIIYSVYRHYFSLLAVTPELCRHSFLCADQ